MGQGQIALACKPMINNDMKGMWRKSNAVAMQQRRTQSLKQQSVTIATTSYQETLMSIRIIHQIESYNEARKVYRSTVSCNLLFRKGMRHALTCLCQDS